MENSRPTLLGAGVLATLLVAAPLCEVIEAAISPLTDSTTTADLLAIRAHEGRFVASVLFGLAGTLLVLPAILGLTAVTVRRSPWPSRVAAASASLGLMGFAGIRLGQGIELQGLRDGLPVRQVAGLLDHQYANPIGAPLVTLFLVGTAVGMVALGVVIWRAGLPRPAALLVALFPLADQGLEVLGSNAGGVIAHAALLAGLGWVAVSLLQARAVSRQQTVPLAATG
jgi:hypothetical protein